MFSPFVAHRYRAPPALAPRPPAGLPARQELSFDHKPWLEAELTRIEAAGGSVSYKRVDGELAVSRALGDFQFKDPDLAPEACKVTANPDLNIQVRHPEDQFLVLACDGIWDVMDNDEVIRSVTSYAQLLGEGNPRLLCEELIEDCLAKQSKDNMSAIVVLFEQGRALVGAAQLCVLLRAFIPACFATRSHRSCGASCKSENPARRKRRRRPKTDQAPL